MVFKAHPSEVHRLLREAQGTMRSGSIEESEALVRIDREREERERMDRLAARRASGHRGEGRGPTPFAHWDD